MSGGPGFFTSIVFLCNFIEPSLTKDGTQNPNKVTTDRINLSYAIAGGVAQSSRNL